MPRNPFIDYRTPNLPKELSDFREFLAAIEASEKELNLISARKTSQYNLISIKKRSGGIRTLSVPNNRLKYIQRKILSLLSPLYRPKWCVQGFVEKRSALENAQRHVGREHLIKVDLKDFFDQITSGRVRGVLNYFGIPTKITDAILNLCLLDGKLPQGAPTSPLLSNMVAFRLDQRLVEFSKSNRLKYTRYADDLVFSSFSQPKILKSATQSTYLKMQLTDLAEGFISIFKTEGFIINEEKNLVLRTAFTKKRYRIYRQ